MFNNPGWLKLDLAIRGARLSNGLDQDHEIFRVPTLLDHAGRTVEVILPEDVPVNVPVGEQFTHDSPYILHAQGDGFALFGNGKQCPVRIAPQPRFYAQRTRSGLPMWQVETAYGGSWPSTRPPAATSRRGASRAVSAMCRHASASGMPP